MNGDERCITIMIVDDSLFEGDETIVVELSGVTGTATPSSTMTTVTITNNDGMISFSVFNFVIIAAVISTGSNIAIL